MSYQSESPSASSCEVSEAAGEYNEEVYTRRVYAGKRTYFLDVKSTRSGDDFFVTITERKRLQGGGQKKFRVFLYKEDFGEFVRALHDVIHHIREERLPDHEFDLLPDLAGVNSDEGKEPEREEGERDE